MPCSTGANHCRLRLFGWEKRGHGLTSRPRESSARALLAGTLPLRYCATRFASGTLTWRLPVPGLVAGTFWEVQEAVAEGMGRRVRWVSGSGPNRRTSQV